MADAGKGAVRPTLFIGLGGTGKEILLRLRRKFYERWGVKGLPCMGYLWIDTDSRDVLARGETIDEIDLELGFEEHEKVALLQSTLGQDLGAVLTEKLRNRHIHAWLPAEVEQFGRETGHGAGAVRAIGRLTFFDKYRAIDEAITRSLQWITDRPRLVETQERFLPGVEFDTSPQVHLVFSVAGGTGGGTFLDTAFLLRKHDVRKLTGLMLLPNVYYSTLNDEGAERSYGNAYAALKELEFFTRRVRPVTSSGDDLGLGADFDVNWTGRKEERIQGPPFSVLYMCEMKNEEDIGAGNRTELFHMIADSLYLDFLPSSFSTQKRSRLSDIFQYMASIQDDDVPVSGTTLRQSFSRRYASFGMSKIEIPFESIRESCACQLADEILRHINRPSGNPSLQATLKTTVTGRFDAEGLEALFGNQWKAEISGAVAKEFPEALPNDGEELQRLLDELPERFRKFEETYLNAEGYDRKRWGIVTSHIRTATADAAEKLRRDLRQWMAETLEQSELGLTALRSEAGLVALLMNQFRKIHRDDPESRARAQEATADAEEYKRQRTEALAGMEYALQNRAVGYLGVRRWTLRTLYDRLRDVIEQHGKSVAAACLAEEAGKVAKSGDDFLREWAARLNTFGDALAPLASKFAGLSRNFRSFERTFCSIRVMTDDDFERCYLLDFDEQSGKHAPVHPPSEYRRLVQGTIGATAGTLEVLEHWERGGDTWLQSTLRSYTAERFRKDFELCRNEKDKHRTCGRFIEVLTHPALQRDLASRHKQFVSSALPMLKRGRNRLGGSTGSEVKKVYLGLPAKGTALYDDFEKTVTQLLSSHGYPPPTTFITDDPTSVVLFTETYAFPLPNVDLVTGRCHDAYYDFYHSMNRDRQNKAHKIPLHLCAPWEGEFDDLKPIEESLAAGTYEALTVLTLGPLLGVVHVTPRGGRREYTYREWVAPASVPKDLGNKRSALEFFRREERLRRSFLALLTEREERLHADLAGNSRDGETYFWALSYLRFALVAPGTPEHSIVTERLRTWDGYLHAAGRSIPELTDLPREQQIAHCRQKLGDSVEWVDNVPRLRALPALVLGGREETKPATNFGLGERVSTD
jgi:hypothetical protein